MATHPPDPDLERANREIDRSKQGEPLSGIIGDTGRGNWRMEPIYQLPDEGEVPPLPPAPAPGPKKD